MNYLIPALAALLLTPGLAAGSGISVDTLVQGSTAWDGGAFSYPQGTPQITVVRIRVPAGEGFPWHCHPMPLAGSITRGMLEITKPDGQSITVRAGDGLIEVSNQWHRGFAHEDVELIVVYAGAEGQPLTLNRNADSAPTAACK